MSRWCTCGCGTPIRSGMYVYQIGTHRYAQKCVHRVYLDLIDEKILDRPAAPIDGDAPVQPPPTATKG